MRRRAPYSILVRDLEPVDGPTSLRPIAARLQAVLVVANTLNTATGTEGVVWLSDMQLGVVDSTAPGLWRGPEAWGWGPAPISKVSTDSVYTAHGTPRSYAEASGPHARPRL